MKGLGIKPFVIRVCHLVSGRCWIDTLYGHAGEILTVDDFREVKAALHKARPQWRQLGVELGIPVDDLESFEMDGRNVEERLHNMLKAWLRKRSLRPTWERLVAALRAENVDREDIACDIAEEYLN